MIDADVQAAAMPARDPLDRRANHEPPRLRLHVMPGCNADPRVRIRERRVRDRHVEVHFEYCDTALCGSIPGHVVYLAVLTHFEDVIHAWACHALGRDGARLAPERIHVWPSIVDVSMPQVSSASGALVQEVHIEELLAAGAHRFLVKSRSHVNDCLTIEGTTPIEVL